MTVEADLDVLIPTYRRPDALAVTLAGLANQTVHGFRVVVADQTEGRPVTEAVPVATMLRRLALAGSVIDARVHRERAGMAEQRQFLLDSAQARHVLYLDDDVFLDAATLARMLAAIRELGCGFVGCAPRGLSYLADHRPAQLAPFEPLDGPPGPERVRKGQPAWDRWMLHNAANAEHLAARVDLPERGWLAYRVAWVAGCVLYDRAALVAGGRLRVLAAAAGQPSRRGDRRPAPGDGTRRRGGAPALRRRPPGAADRGDPPLGRRLRGGHRSRRPRSRRPRSRRPRS